MLVMLFFDNFTPEGCAINNPTRKCGENEIPPHLRLGKTHSLLKHNTYQSNK